MANRLFVGNLPWSATEKDIREFFGDGNECKVIQVKIITDRETGRSRGFAFVDVSSPAEVEAAIRDLDRCELGGRTVNVKQAEERPRGERSEPRRDDRGSNRKRDRDDDRYDRD